MAIFHSYVSLPEGNLSLYARSRLLLFFFETGGVPLLACYAGRTPGKFTGSYWLLVTGDIPEADGLGKSSNENMFDYQRVT
jgi:hypothetical protein